MMNKFLILLGSLFALTFFGCNPDEEEDDLIDTLEKEKIAIHEYLSTISSPILYIEYYSVNGQLIDTLYIFNHDNSGEKARDTGWVLMDYEKFFLNGDKLDTTDPQPGDSLIFLTYGVGGPILYRLDTVKKYDYVAEALRHLSIGGIGGEVIIPSVLAGDKDNYGRTLHYKLKAHKYIDDVKKNESEFIQNYFDTYLPGNVPFRDFPTRELSAVSYKDTVTYTAVVKKGAGDRNIQTGDSVMLEMSSWILSEIESQQTEARLFALDSANILFNETWQKGYTSGLVKGLQRLQEGDSAHIVVPYGMAYGVAGTTRDITVNKEKRKQNVVPRYSTLLYTVKIRKVIAPKTEE